MIAKRILTFLLKPKAVVFGACVFLLVFVGYHEREIERFSGCWDCGWETRQAIYLVIAALGLLIGRLWSAIVSLIASMKVIITVGLVAFAENLAEVKGVWPILKSSVKWSLESHPEFFVEITLALGIELVVAGSSAAWSRSEFVSAASNTRLERTRR